MARAKRVENSGIRTMADHAKAIIDQAIACGDVARASKALEDLARLAGLWPETAETEPVRGPSGRKVSASAATGKVVVLSNRALTADEWDKLYTPDM